MREQTCRKGGIPTGLSTACNAASAVSLAFALSGILAPITAGAALLSLNDPHFGANSLTHDTLTGFDWLDLTKSVHRSYNDMVGNDGSNEFLAGGDFYGFRYATTNEVAQLFLDAGVVTLGAGFGYTAANFTAVHDLLALVGTFGAGPGFTVTSGLTGSFYDSNADKVWLGQLQTNDNINPPGGLATVDSTITLLNTAAFNNGSWLIGHSAPIPEPATALLLCLGLFGIGYGGRAKS